MDKSVRRNAHVPSSGLTSYLVASIEQIVHSADTFDSDFEDNF